MKSTATFVRGVVVASLALCGVMTVVGVLLMPDFTGGFAERLTAIAADPTGATVSALLFTGAQLPFAVGLVGIAHLLRDRTPRLATLGALFAVLGGFGHAVYGGVNVLMLAMAEDLGNLAVHADVLARAESGLGIPFMAMGLLGTVVGLVLLGAGVWRGGLGPRWAGPALIAFVLVEFVGSSLSVWAGYASGVLYLVSFGALTVTAARTTAGTWEAPATTAGHAPVTAPVTAPAG